MSRLTASTVPAVDPVSALRRLASDGDTVAPRLVPGTRLFVDVLEALPGGGVRARTTDGDAEYRLPFDARPGARLHVLVSGTEARPGFVLVATETSATSTLSAAAKVLGALTAATGNAVRPPVIGARAPLAAPGEVNAATLARGLVDALRTSGLFYEAHLAQWLAGKRDRGTLMDEPQAKATLRDARSGSEPAPLADTASGVHGNASGLDGIVHRDTVPLVQQQLAALDTGAFVWRGDAWRGQAVEWTVESPADERRARDEDEREAAPGVWRTRLTLTMPTLGRVDARLAVHGNGIALDIVTHRAETSATLATARDALTTAFAAAGLQLGRLAVRHES